MLMILWVWFYPEAALAASWWYLHHIPQVVAVGLLIDLVVWIPIYRRYRKAHPWEKVTLRR